MELMKLDDWLLERIQSIYPLFRADDSEVVRFPAGVISITRLIGGKEKTIKPEYTLNGDKKHTIGYNVAFEGGTLYVKVIPE